jgi:hypothetical protein
MRLDHAAQKERVIRSLNEIVDMLHDVLFPGGGAPAPSTPTYRSVRLPPALRNNALLSRLLPEEWAHILSKNATRPYDEYMRRTMENGTCAIPVRREKEPELRRAYVRSCLGILSTELGYTPVVFIGAYADELNLPFMERSDDFIEVCRRRLNPGHELRQFTFKYGNVHIHIQSSGDHTIVHQLKVDVETGHVKASRLQGFDAYATALSSVIGRLITEHTMWTTEHMNELSPQDIIEAFKKLKTLIDGDITLLNNTRRGSTTPDIRTPVGAFGEWPSAEHFSGVD